MKPVYITIPMLVIVIGFIVFLVFASQPVVDCGELMEDRAIIFGNMNNLLEALEENKNTVTEEKRIMGLELVDRLLEDEDKLAIEWKTKCT